MESIESLLASSSSPSNSSKLVMDDLFDTYLSQPSPHTSTSQLIGHLPTLQPSDSAEDSDHFDTTAFDALPPLSPIFSPASLADDLCQPSTSSSSTTPLESPLHLDDGGSSEDDDGDSSVEEHQSNNMSLNVASHHQTATQLSASKTTTRTGGQRTAATKRKVVVDSDSSYREDSDSSNDKSNNKGKALKDEDKEKPGSNKQQRRRLQNRNAAATSRMKRKQYVTSLEEKVEGLLAQQRAMTQSLNQLQAENQQLKQLMQQQPTQTHAQPLQIQQQQLANQDGELPSISLEPTAQPQQLYVHNSGFRSMADELHLHQKGGVAPSSSSTTTQVFNFSASPTSLSVFNTINASPASALEADQSLALLPTCRVGARRQVSPPALIRKVLVAEHCQPELELPLMLQTAPWSAAPSDSAQALWMVQFLLQAAMTYSFMAAMYLPAMPQLLSSSMELASASLLSSPTPTWPWTSTSSAACWRTFIEQQILFREHIQQQLSKSPPCPTRLTDCLDGTATWQWLQSEEVVLSRLLPQELHPRVVEITV